MSGRKPDHIQAGHRCFEVAGENRRIFYLMNQAAQCFVEKSHT